MRKPASRLEPLRLAGRQRRVSHEEQTVSKTEAVAPDQDQKQRLLHDDELSTVNGGFGFVEHSATIVIKWIGEALSTVARKQ
jgi:hypothetical protein